MNFIFNPSPAIKNIHFNVHVATLANTIAINQIQIGLKIADERMQLIRFALKMFLSGYSEEILPGQVWTSIVFDAKIKLLLLFEN